MWAHAKRKFIKGGHPKRHLYGHLATFMLQRKLASQPGEPFVNFISEAHKCAAAGYPVGDHALHLPGPDPELDDGDTESDTEEDLEDFRELLTDWAETEDSFIELPHHFTPRERRLLHILCEELGLQHESVGEGEDRRMRVTRQHTTPAVAGELVAVNVSDISDVESRGEELAIEYPDSDSSLPHPPAIEFHPRYANNDSVDTPSVIAPNVTRRKRKLPSYLNDYDLTT